MADYREDEAQGDTRERVCSGGREFGTSGGDQIAEFERKLAERRRHQLALGRADTIVSDEVSIHQKRQDVDLELGNNSVDPPLDAVTAPHYR